MFNNYHWASIVLVLESVKYVSYSPRFGIRFGATGSLKAKELTVCPMGDRVYGLVNFWCTVW